MNAKIRDLRQKRAKLIADARVLIDRAEAENRDLTQEENNNYDRMMAEADSLQSRAERMEHAEQAAADLGASAGDGRDYQPGQAPGGGSEATEQRLAQFSRYLPHWITQDFRGLAANELRALQADLDASGGYLRPPEQFVNGLIKNIGDQTFIRQWATTYTVTNAESLGIPTLEADPADSDWTSELATGSEDSTMAFGKRALTPHPLAKRIKISKKLIRAVPNSEQLVRDRLAYKFGITFEKACLTGTGAQQPLGIFTASNDGIGTSRDVSTGNTSTAITFDGLIEAKYKLKSQYWPNARWLFHRDAMKMIAKLKDGNNQYLWRESVMAGEPDRLLGLPAFVSEYAPNTFTTGLYVGIIGDFRNYWIVDALTMEFQLLNELYAGSNQVGLIGRLESDGMPVLGEAFARVTLA